MTKRSLAPLSWFSVLAICILAMYCSAFSPASVAASSPPWHAGNLARFGSDAARGSPQPQAALSTPSVGSASVTSVADSWQLPLDGAWSPLTQDFNVWNQSWNGYHLGQDIIRSSEVPVYAAANGRVKYSGSAGGYGHVVIIEHSLPDSSVYVSLYGHLKSADRVANGADVSKGQMIGRLSGVSDENGGYSFIHLHFGIREGSYTAQQYTCAGKTLWLYTGYSRACDAFSPSHWRKGSEFISQHGGSTGPACPAPANGSPSGGVTLNDYQVTFSWTPPACSGLDYFTFRVANQPNLDAGPWIIDHGVSKDASSVSESIPAQYGGQTLYWAIWPHNGAGYGSRGGPWAFRIDTSVPPTPTPLPTGNWQIEYFRNKELTDRCATSSQASTFIFRDWGEGAPAGGCNSDNWGTRFTRRVHLPGGSYTFAVEADDWGRFYVNSDLVVDKWNGASQHYESRYLNAGDYDFRIEFADTAGVAKISAWWWGPGYNVPHETRDDNQWYANYWLNRDQWWDAFASRNEGTGRLQHDWGYSGPGWDMPGDGFSAKFRRRVYFDCGRYRFQLYHDDGARFSVDGALALDRWGSVGNDVVDLDLTRGYHELQVDHFENWGAANVSLDWSTLSGCGPALPTLVSPANGAHLTWGTPLILGWNASAGATEYYAHLEGGPSTVIDSGWSSDTQWQLGGLEPGTYTWWVRARNAYGDSGISGPWTFTVLMPPAPVADFDAWPQSGGAPLTVSMHTLASGNYDSCEWDYGDNTTGNSCAAYHDHTYWNPGSYTVKLTVTGPGGSDTMTRSNYIAVDPLCYTMTTSVSPDGVGSISTNPGPNCGGGYTAGTTVQLTANANAGYRFANWSGDATGTSNPTTITMNGHKSVAANFLTSEAAKPDLRPHTPAGYSFPVVPSAMQGDHTVSTLYADARTFFDWHFTNSGNASASSFHVELWVDGHRFVRYPFSGYASGQSGGFDDWSETVSQPGRHTVRLIVDPDNAIDELDESNNTWEGQFDWHPILGWKGEYFNNSSLEGNPWLTRDDSRIDFEWRGDPPAPPLPADGFSVRWTRTMYFLPGTYHVQVFHDDGARLFVDGAQVFENWCDNCRLQEDLDLAFIQGNHTLRLEMWENAGWAAASLTVASASAQYQLYLPLLSAGNGLIGPARADRWQATPTPGSTVTNTPPIIPLPATLRGPTATPTASALQP